MSFGKFTRKEIIDLVSCSWSPYWGAGSPGPPGPSTSPGLPLNSIQFNSGSAFSGSSFFTYDPALAGLYFTGSMFVSGAISASSGANTVGFYGTSSWAVSASYINLLAGTDISIVYGTSGITINNTAGAGSATDIWKRSFGSQSAVLIAHSESFAGGTGSVAFGFTTTASGDFSFTHGKNSFAPGVNSHAEGVSTQAYGSGSHAEGHGTRTGDITFSPIYEYFSQSLVEDFIIVSYDTGSLWDIGGPNVSNTYVVGVTDPTWFTRWLGSDHFGNFLNADQSNYPSLTYALYVSASGPSGIESYPIGDIYDDTTGTGYYYLRDLNSAGLTYTDHTSATGSTDSLYSGNGNPVFETIVGYSVNVDPNSAYAHAEGTGSIASGNSSHAEGFFTNASGRYSHAEGVGSSAQGQGAHAEGSQTIAAGVNSHAEGSTTMAGGNESHAEGSQTTASGNGSHAEGIGTLASGPRAHAEGSQTTAAGEFSHAEGVSTQALGYGSHTEGYLTLVSIGAQHAHAEGNRTRATSNSAHAEGFETLASGLYSHAEGDNTSTQGGDWSHAEGSFTRTSAYWSHAEGRLSTASAEYSHAEGVKTVTSGIGSHTEGVSTSTYGIGSHAEGSGSIAAGNHSHASGIFTIASGSGQAALGKYNLPNNDISLFVIGDGTDEANRHDLLRANPGVVQITGSLIVSNSFELIGNGNVTGSFNVSSSLTVIGTNTTTGSVFITGSSTLIGDSTITGSIFMTGSAAISKVNYIDFVTTAAPAHQEGRIHWIDDIKTINVDTDVNNFSIELGHQNVVRVYNDTGADIQLGKVVRISGSQGNQPTIVTASWFDDQSSATTLGFAATLISGSGGNKHGYVITNGLLRNVDTNAYTVGTQLYLSSSGNFTNTPPDAPLHEVRLGKVVVKNSATGIIFVDIMNGYELTELHDVRTTAYTNGDLLIQSGSLWINSKQLTGSYGLTGSLTAISGGFTGSLFGTSSWAQSSSQALIASFVTGSIFTSTNRALSSSFAITASFTLSSSFATTSSFASTASFYGGSIINSQLPSQINVVGVSASFTGSLTGALIGTASWAQSSSQALTASFYNGTISNSQLPLQINVTGVSASFTGSLTGALIGTSSWSTNSLTASYVTGSVFTSTNPALSSSYALTASYALSGVGGSSTPAFPFNGNAVITGSLLVSGSSGGQSGITGSLFGTSSWATNALTASITYVTSSNFSLSEIEVADYSNDVAVTFTNGRLKFIFGVPVSSSITSFIGVGFNADRFNLQPDNFTASAAWANNGYTFLTASIYTGSTLLATTTTPNSTTLQAFFTNNSGSQTYRFELTASNPLNNSTYTTSSLRSLPLSKTNPGNPTQTATATVQLGAGSSQIEQGATGSIVISSTSGAPNSWNLIAFTGTGSFASTTVTTFSGSASPGNGTFFVTGSATGSNAITFTTNARYNSNGLNSPETFVNVTDIDSFTKIRSIRYGTIATSATSSITSAWLENLANWDNTLGGSIGTIVKGTVDPTTSGYTATALTTNGNHFIFVINSTYTLTSILNTGANLNDLPNFTSVIHGSYKAYYSTNPSIATITYKLIR